jgi:deoxyribodipyrimidine photo-lyase
LIIEWSPSPREALRRMYALNDRWALDGRDPNSISGIMWTFGRYDHPWPPARAITGTLRPMTSISALRKLRVRGFLERYGAGT